MHRCTYVIYIHINIYIIYFIVCIHGHIHHSLTFILCYCILYLLYLIYIILHITYPLYLHILRDIITVYHSGEITASYSQNLVYLISSNRCNIKHQGKTSDYLFSPGQRNLFLDIQTTIII